MSDPKDDPTATPSGIAAEPSSTPPKKGVRFAEQKEVFEYPSEKAAESLDEEEKSRKVLPIQVPIDSVPPPPDDPLLSASSSGASFGPGTPMPYDADALKTEIEKNPVIQEAGITVEKGDDDSLSFSSQGRKLVQMAPGGQHLRLANFDEATFILALEIILQQEWPSVKMQDIPEDKQGLVWLVAQKAGIVVEDYAPKPEDVKTLSEWKTDPNNSEKASAAEDRLRATTEQQTSAASSTPSTSPS